MAFSATIRRPFLRRDKFWEAFTLMELSCLPHRSKLKEKNTAAGV
jgi:hypothetical protein